jgi:hypothetical protein
MERLMDISNQVNHISCEECSLGCGFIEIDFENFGGDLHDFD